MSSGWNFLLDRRTGGKRVTLRPFPQAPVAELRVIARQGRVIIDSDFAEILHDALGEFITRSRPEASVLTAEPVRIEAIRWKCPFCSKSSSRRPGIRPHIETCYHNPAAQACGTCYRYDPPSEENNWVQSCVKGAPMTEMVEDKWNPDEKREVMVRNCPEWLAMPEKKET